MNSQTTLRLYIVLFSIVMLMLSVCGGCSHRKNERLARISDTISDNPALAIRSLDSIRSETLTDADRHFYDFLWVKANDKAYVKHHSDSLILDVIDYYSSRKSDPLYPEALYYGGRVNSDLGDYPTALQYYHKAIDVVEERGTKASFVHSLYSQTGRLLESMRLYEEAIPYIESALQDTRALHDTINTIHNLHLLGMTNVNSKDYAKANRYLNEALTLSSSLSDTLRRRHLTATSLIYITARHRVAGELDTAVSLIKTLPYKVGPLMRNTALAKAASVYLEAGMLDSAYKAAYELIHNQDMQGKKRGYQVILNPKLLRFSSCDSIAKYATDYATLLDKDFDSNNKALTLMQRSSYNYNLHEIKREKAEKSNRRLWLGISVAVIGMLCLVILVLWLKYRNKRAMVKLQEAIIKISELEESLNAHGNTERRLSRDTASATDESPNLPDMETIEGLKHNLKERLLSLYTHNTDEEVISASILESDAYAKLHKIILSGETIKDNDPIWHELEELILSISPQFKSNLQILLNGKLTTNDYHTAMLVKCGVAPTQMASLFGRSKGTITSRRETMCKKITGENLGTKVIDSLIRLL